MSKRPAGFDDWGKRILEVKLNYGSSLFGALGLVFIVYGSLFRVCCSVFVVHPQSETQNA